MAGRAVAEAPSTSAGFAKLQEPQRRKDEKPPSKVLGRGALLQFLAHQIEHVAAIPPRRQRNADMRTWPARFNGRSPARSGRCAAKTIKRSASPSSQTQYLTPRSPKQCSVTASDNSH